MDKKGDSIDNKNINLLIENSIALQKVLANLALSLDEIARDTKKMLLLFEEASKEFSGTKKTSASPEIRGMQSRLDNLVEQNKLMANSIVLLDSYLRGKSNKEEDNKLKRLPQFNY